MDWCVTACEHTWWRSAEESLPPNRSGSALTAGEGGVVMENLGLGVVVLKGEGGRRRGSGMVEEVEEPALSLWWWWWWRSLVVAGVVNVDGVRVVVGASNDSAGTERCACSDCTDVDDVDDADNADVISGVGGAGIQCQSILAPSLAHSFLLHFLSFYRCFFFPPSFLPFLYLNG